MSEKGQIYITKQEGLLVSESCKNSALYLNGNKIEDGIQMLEAIQKQQKEIEIQNKMINLMAEDLKIGDEYLSSEYNFTGYENYTIEQIKEEYRKRAENE